ncbi:MAG: DNA-3-methyladenine glycosylase [Firmicutes bacterium]|nr:DNA-3-methyladenine glycosylase [Bacillota bacterium]MBQ3199432.1 DNA-3-methyladenine glycosylase [Bacillota bacterium]
MRDFYLRDANTVAPELLGKLLVHNSSQGVTSGIIVEVESYIGPHDKGAHSYLNKRTKRTEIQFGLGGYAYIYAIYGMHLCFNVVVNICDKPEVVLIRALEPVDGIELMRQRRNIVDRVELCNGPGKLCKSMGITIEHYGYDLCKSELYIEPLQHIDKTDIMVSPRINIDYADECKDYLWRYFIKDNPYISRVAGRYKKQQKVMEK